MSACLSSQGAESEINHLTSYSRSEILCAHFSNVMSQQPKMYIIYQNVQPHVILNHVVLL